MKPGFKGYHYLKYSKSEDYNVNILSFFRSSHLEVFLVKGVLKICSKFTGEHPYQSVVSIKLQINCGWVATSGWLLLLFGLNTEINGDFRKIYISFISM